MKKAKRPRGLAARFKQLEIDEILLAERRAKLERQAMTKGKPIDDYARAAAAGGRSGTGFAMARSRR